uniref:FABP family protein n=1 Tax=Candidatus Planktophila sp. TaxID=2175601 RepID=UPI00404B4651
MVFTIPEGLHPDLNPLAWLVGTWRGKGHGEYPTIKPFQFISEIVFNHDGRPFLNYFSRSWIVDDDGEIIRPGASEAGFWRIKPNNVLEVVISHNTGITEGWLGHFDGPKIQLAMDQGYSAPSAKIVTAGVRLYGLV